MRMIDQEGPEGGIDFLDFIFGIWRSKWLFLSVFLGVAIVVTGGILSIAKMQSERGAVINKSGAGAHEKTLSAHFLYYVNYVSAPYRRSQQELTIDLLDRLRTIDTLGLQNDRAYLKGFARPDRLFAMQELKAGEGMITLDLKDGSAELASKVRDEFIAAAKLQFEATRNQVNADVGMLRELTSKYYTKRSESLAREFYFMLHFLSRKSVQDGTFRFFEFEPLVISSQKVALPGSMALAASSSQSVVKGGAIALLLGFISACVVIVFRIAIERKSTK